MRASSAADRSDFTGTRRSLVGCLLTISALAWVVSAPLSFAEDSPAPKNLLILYSFSDRRLFDPIDNLKSAIRSRVNSPVNFYVHYMEAQGLEDPNYERSLSENLRSELRGVKLDLVITAVYSSYQFALRHRNELFPGVPVVFSYVHASRVRALGEDSDVEAWMPVGRQDEQRCDDALVGHRR